MGTNYKTTYHKRTIVFTPDAGDNQPKYSVTLTDERGVRKVRYFASEHDARQYIDGKNVDKTRYLKPIDAIEYPDSWDKRICPLKVLGVLLTSRMKSRENSATKSPSRNRRVPKLPSSL